MIFDIIGWAEATVQECQLNRAKPREVKENSYKLSKNQR